MSKQRYSPPALRDLTFEQAKKIIADSKNCSEEKATEFLESLQRQKPKNDQKRNDPPARWGSNSRISFGSSMQVRSSI